MKKALIGLMLVVLIVGTLACSRAVKTEPPVTSDRGTVVPVPAPAPLPPGFKGSEGGGGIAVPGVPSTQDRLIIRQGNLTLVVNDVIESRDRIGQLATSLGGFVVSSQIFGEGDGLRGSITIRVPDNQFEPALSQLRSLAVRVKTESTNSQDVTEEYVDLQSRLKNAEATEQQYLAILQKATTVEDTLKVYDSLNRVRQEIEQIKGRIQYLERTTSMSLISVQLEPVSSGKPVVEAGWSFAEVVKAALRGAVAVGQGILQAFVWIIVFSPLWLLVAGGIYWLVKRLLR